MQSSDKETRDTRFRHSRWEHGCQTSWFQKTTVTSSGGIVVVCMVTDEMAKFESDSSDNRLGLQRFGNNRASRKRMLIIEWSIIPRSLLDSSDNGHFFMNFAQGIRYKKATCASHLIYIAIEPQSQQTLMVLAGVTRIASRLGRSRSRPAPYPLFDLLPSAPQEPGTLSLRPLMIPVCSCIRCSSYTDCHDGQLHHSRCAARTGCRR